MSTESNIHYVIDPEDRISSVDSGWCDFARANDGEELLPERIIGRSLWEFISDDMTRNLYRQIVARVRDGRLARFTLRCDGPDCRRLLEMRLHARPDGSVEFETVPLRVENRDSAALLDRRVRRSAEFLKVCAWCNRVDLGLKPTRWVEVEDATEQLGLFELDRMPQMTHGMCESCLESMSDTLEALDGPEAGSGADLR